MQNGSLMCNESCIALLVNAEKLYDVLQEI